MNCINCGAVLNRSPYCPSCGFHVETQKKIWYLSNLYYNQGLDKAQIRDLSGAIDLLKRSLRYNKRNIPARNLLGLIYYEMGEAVAALSEWVISKNLMPENNIASEYIDKLQENANKLDVFNQTIQKYNDSLRCCQKGSEDVAVIQLKKILNQNPKFIKAYHLLSLIYIHQEEYEKARRLLKKAVKIDRTNATTLRFLKEIEEQTGTLTNLESRHRLFGNNGMTRSQVGQSVAYMADNDLVIQPPTFRESSLAATLLNLGFGFLVGACIVWFLLVPANTQKINREANEKVVSYSDTMASQAAELNKLEKEVEESKATLESANQQIEQAVQQTASHENLIKAYVAYKDGQYTQAGNVLQNVVPELLSVDAKQIYDQIYQEIKSTIQSNLKKQGVDAFYDGKYDQAIESLTEVLSMEDFADDYECMNVLAHAFRLKGDFVKSKEAFQAIVDKFPGTRRATSAQRYVDNNGHAPGEQVPEEMTPSEPDPSEGLSPAERTGNPEGSPEE